MYENRCTMYGAQYADYQPIAKIKMTAYLNTST
jgi:hypothetical protein